MKMNAIIGWNGEIAEVTGKLLLINEGAYISLYKIY